VAFGVLRAGGRIDLDFAIALIGGGAVAAVGFADDKGSVSPSVKLAIHLLAAIWATVSLGGLPPLQLGGATVSLGVVGNVAAALGIVWTLNLFNFMDGIDGLAASEAVFVTCGGALLAGPSAHGVSTAGLVLGSTSLGFLVWNWAPAKIFMGDVGSGYLGYLIAVLALASSRNEPQALWVWLILGGVFFVDATVTLIRRLARGERIHEAHRSHAYQTLARRWASHRRVTIAVMGVNLGWLLPCAWIASRLPEYAAWIAGVALAPVILLSLAVGAGRDEPGGIR
jgi:Fuc2NAc and GlcNAc transferase